MVDDKGTEGKELAKRKASGDESPYGSVELCLSFRPEDMNAAAVHLHEYNQYEDQQQAQPEEEHEQPNTGVQYESDGDCQQTGACGFIATAAVTLESEANDTAEDASDSDPEYQEKPAEAAAEGQHGESTRTGSLDRAAAAVLPEPKATKINSTVSEPVADKVEVEDRPAKLLEPKA
eukprot:COSAG02_NODE_29088_length_576_cov_0.960168_1_plen_176_part_10